jgi:hypothetical protein
MSAPVFTPVGADGGPIDLTKSVRYAEGMILGAADFHQEHEYLAGLAGEALRAGVGVGTLLGLKASLAKRADTNAVEVHVEKGVAVDSRGRMIRVAEEQCADLGAWVKSQPAAVGPKVVVDPADNKKGKLALAVTVSYARTPTDVVPLAGEPCRTDDQLMTASRWQDDYRLKLTPDAPRPPRFREAFRQFLQWTKYALKYDAVAVADRNKLADGVADLLRACRTNPPTADRVIQASLPPATVQLALNRDDMDLQMFCLDAAAVVLVTELLPAWFQAHPPGDAAEELLLAELSVAVKRESPTADWELDVAAALTPAVSRARPVALGGAGLRFGPRLPVPASTT